MSGLSQAQPQQPSFGGMFGGGAGGAMGNPFAMLMNMFQQMSPPPQPPAPQQMGGGPQFGGGFFGGQQTPQVDQQEMERRRQLREGGMATTMDVPMIGGGSPLQGFNPKAGKPVSSGSRSIRSGAGSGFPSFFDSFGRR